MKSEESMKTHLNKKVSCSFFSLIIDQILFRMSVANCYFLVIMYGKF